MRLTCSACKSNESSVSLCSACVIQSVKAHRSQLRNVQNAAALAARKAAQQADFGAAERAKSETHARFNRAVQDLEERLSKECAGHEEKSACIEATATRLRQRRHNLYSARRKFSAVTEDTASPGAAVLAAYRERAADLQKRWDDLAGQVAHARKILVAEAIATFGPEVKQTALASKAFKSRFVLPKTRLQHRLAGSPLPSFAELKAACSSRNLPQTNAAIYEFAHCLTLVASYLGLALPFAIALGSSPSICGSYASPWMHRYPSMIALDYAPSKSSDASVPTLSFTNFVTAYTMLVYDLAYLCHTQGLPIDLDKVNEIVPALLSLAQLPAQIRPSDTLAYLPVPDDLAHFTVLDFRQLLESNVAHATSNKTHMNAKVEFVGEEEDWRVVKFG